MIAKEMDKTVYAEDVNAKLLGSTLMMSSRLHIVNTLNCTCTMSWHKCVNTLVQSPSEIDQTNLTQ